MIYIRSILAGVAALIIAALITGLIVFGGPLMKTLTSPAGSGGIGFFVVGFHPLHVLGISLLIFAAGFFWQYRRRH
jgi:hypothetical protein